ILKNGRWRGLKKRGGGFGMKYPGWICGIKAIKYQDRLPLSLFGIRSDEKIYDKNTGLQGEPV
ncbi:MAG: hypothetical protein ACLFS7_05385, partial [Desulfosudaceae bacterium]